LAKCRGSVVVNPSDYARWRASSFGQLTERLEQEVIFELAGDVHGRSVLDAGCGDGSYSILAWTRGARVWGVDSSPAMLEAACRWAQSFGAHIEFCRTSMEQLPFGSGVFDVVIAVTALCFVKDPQRAVLEAARVLRPGGRLIIGELGKYSLWALFRRLRGWFGASTWRKARFWTAGSLRRLIEQAGLHFHSVRGCVYYPPIEPAARLMVKADRVLSHLGSVGAAFLAVRAGKV